MIYLDNAASTKPTKAVLETAYSVANEYFANPSSLHRMGMKANELLETARRKITASMGLTPEWLIFTSCATEANQTVLKCGIRNANKNRNHILMSSIEHSSVINTKVYLQDKGYEVELLTPDQNGFISPELLKSKIRSSTEMVSIIGVHNEIGAINDISKLKNIIKQTNPKTLFHVDGVQWFGKFPLPLIEDMPDFFTFSGHKLNAPRGVGGIIRKPGLDLKPLLHGGGQEFKHRSGTENLPAIEGLRKAIEDKNYLIHENCLMLQKTLYEFATNHQSIKWLGAAPGKNRSPFINLLAIKDKKSEVLIHQLEEKEIYVSSGSACSEKSGQNQNNWNFLNLPNNYREGIIRISFSFESNQSDIESFINALKVII